MPPRPRRHEEADVQAAIIDLCRRLGLLVFHDNDPRRNVAGFPDLLIVGFGSILWVELKTDRNEPTADQRVWLAALAEGGADVRVYRTSQWKTGDLAEELKAIRRNWINTHPGETSACMTQNYRSHTLRTSTPTAPPRNQRGGNAASAASGRRGR